MRIPVSCHECYWADFDAAKVRAAEAEARGESPAEPSPWASPTNPDHWYLADIEEDNAYVGKCRHGHTMKATLQAMRYELLYESGIVATLMGFHREAVSSIAAALERFFEFSIEVFTRRSGVDSPTTEDAWKQVRTQSERQLGAFLFLFLANVKRPFLSGKALGAYETWSSFRNGVIHQGRFPSTVETMNYARYVFDLVQDTRAILKSVDADAVEQIELRHFHRGHEAVRAKAGPPVPDRDGMYRGAGSAAMPMMLSTFNVDAPQDFDARLAESRANLGLWGFAERRQSPQTGG